MTWCCSRHSPEWPVLRACNTCGNKRCPRTEDCAMACTRSNAAGQVGVLKSEMNAVLDEVFTRLCELGGERRP
jgi:hypothetical protein